MIFFKIFGITALFFLFGLSHSFLATAKIKSILVEKIGDKIAFYRLFYNLTSVLFFGFFYFASPRPDVNIYDLHYPYDIVIFVLQTLSLIGFIWAGTYIDLPEFTGIKQIMRYLKEEYNIDDLDEKSHFIIKGPFKYCRHPIYFFSILFLALRPQMDLFYLVFIINITAYFIIGSYYEEKKLVEKFGADYINYQKTVSRIIPKIY